MARAKMTTQEMIDMYGIEDDHPVDFSMYTPEERRALINEAEEFLQAHESIS